MSNTRLKHDKLPEKLARGLDISVSGIVLRSRPFRDSDLMAQLLTPTLGKVSVIGRHARGSKKRFPSSLDVFDRGVARLSREKSGALCVKEFTPSHSLVKLRANLDKLTLASLLCESFDVVLQEDTGEDSSEVFEILDLSLNAIDESTELRIALRATLVALTSLTKREGIIDLSNHPPGSRALNAILDSIERFSERKLMTRSTLAQIMKTIGAQTE
jgi:recombinational DNA repair protein (RecF pathway)